MPVTGWINPPETSVDQEFALSGHGVHRKRTSPENGNDVAPMWIGENPEPPPIVPTPRPNDFKDIWAGDTVDPGSGPIGFQRYAVWDESIALRMLASQSWRADCSAVVGESWFIDDYGEVWRNTIKDTLLDAWQAANPDAVALSLEWELDENGCPGYSSDRYLDVASSDPEGGPEYVDQHGHYSVDVPREDLFWNDNPDPHYPGEPDHRPRLVAHALNPFCYTDPESPPEPYDVVYLPSPPLGIIWDPDYAGDADDQGRVPQRALAATDYGPTDPREGFRKHELDDDTWDDFAILLGASSPGQPYRVVKVWLAPTPVSGTNFYADMTYYPHVTQRWTYHPPRYRINYVGEPTIVVETFRRTIGRDDHLAGGAPRLFPGRSEQADNRTIGGYL